MATGTPPETPVGLTAVDAETGGTVLLSIINRTDYTAGDTILIYDDNNDDLHGVFDASVGSGLIYGLVNNIEYTFYAVCRAANAVDSAESDTADATPTIVTVDPSIPVLTIEDNGDGTATLTVTGSDEGSTNSIYIVQDRGVWSDTPNGVVIGDGSITVELRISYYSAKVTSRA